ncbi:unnamed protein product [Rhizophagus irregularis]|nr:unnamed protein product [Rhizophagus irregularis]
MFSKKQAIQLLATGNLVPTLHYGIYAINWWMFIDRKMPNEKKQMCIPLRLNMRVQLELNKTKFIVRIVSAEDNMKPGYVCESDVAAKIYLSASEAVNKTYNNLFNNKTRYSGPSVLGFDNENITKELLSDVLFCPFKITVDKLSILIINLGNSNGDMSGYQSSFIYKYQDKQSLFIQKVECKYCYIEVFQNKEKVAYYHDASPTDVWKKTGILKNYNELKPEFWTCSVDFNNESNALLYLFNKNLLNGVDKKEAEFIKENKRLKMIIEKFWRSFKETIKANKCGWDGKQRILSIIVENFGHREIQRNLVISNDLINAAKKFSCVNGPGCPAKVKPVVKRNYISEIKDKEFESFFSDKDNVTMRITEYTSERT